MNPYEALIADASPIEGKLGYTFQDKKLVALACVHRSFFNENREVVSEHNERLEFLGDAVLGLFISEYLYKSFPELPEGQLSHLRSQVVDLSTCAIFLQKLGVQDSLLLGKGEKRGDSRGRETILADFFEALMGAIYLDGGLDAVKRVYFQHFQEDVEKMAKAPTRNWKAELQDYSQKKHQKPPLYKVTKESGPDHSKIFHVIVFIGEKQVGEGTGFSKKEAEQVAAEDALKKLETNG